MSIRLAACCFFTILSFHLSAQKQKTEAATLPASYILLRTNIFSVLEPDAHVMLGVEWRKNPQFSLGLDLSYIFYNTFRIESQDPNISGFKIRPEVRRYFKSGAGKNWFIGLEGSYKQVSYNRSREICVNQPQLGCAFFQRVSYKEVKKAPGVAFKIGYQDFLDRGNRFYYELFLGAGVKSLRYSIKDYVQPPNVNFTPVPGSDAFFFNTTSSEGFAPHLPGGIKLGFRL
jgi:hypothetical protein